MIWNKYCIKQGKIREMWKEKIDHITLHKRNRDQDCDARIKMSLKVLRESQIIFSPNNFYVDPIVYEIVWFLFDNTLWTQTHRLRKMFSQAKI